MTNEEAIAYGEDYLKDLITACCHIEEKHKEFVRMAIEALKDNQWQKGYDTATANANETKRSLVEMYEQQIEALKADPCEDAVSRKAVMKLKSHKPEYGDMIYAFDVELLPPVTPKQRTDVLDEIRAEIEQEYTKFRNKSDRWSERACGLGTALEIIDKYKAGGSK